MTDPVPLRIGTRESTLARWQASHVSERLHQHGLRTTLVEFTTTGDALSDVPLTRIPDPDVFTRQLDEALLAGAIDLAVHSLKDVPTTLPAGIVLAAVARRSDPRDALIGRGPVRWADLPSGAVLATSSVRRKAQLLRARPDLTVTELRGNVETRLGKLDRTAEWTGVVLAAAGLTRLGLEARIGEYLPVDLMIPAPGQGAIVVATRAADDAVRDTVRAAVHDPVSGACCAAERALLHRLAGGCEVPVGALAVVSDERLRLVARVVSPDGRRAVDGSLETDFGSDQEMARIGEALAQRLLADGAAGILG
jgi:hydroxymethylbilane synthase